MSQTLQSAQMLADTSVGIAKGVSYLASKASDKMKEFRSRNNIPDIRFEPYNSDLAYLLHDNDEEGISTNTYIVDNLSQYGEKCMPLKVYVSALIRTWETALLVYLPFLYNKEQPNYSQTLILEVSPFLLEGTDKNISKEATIKSKTKSNIKNVFWNSNSNKPLDFKGNVEQFFNFIKLFIYFKKQKDKLSSIVGNALNDIPNKFTIILVAGNDKIYLRVNIQTGTTQVIEYYSSNPTITSNPNPNPINISDLIFKKINDGMINIIKIPNATDIYESYNDNRLSSTNPPPQTIYTTFPMPDVSYFNSFENIAKFNPDIFSFLKWVIEIKSHPKNMPILFVSHSGTMAEFLSLLISNLNYNYTNVTDTSTSMRDFPPSADFLRVFEQNNLRKTNTWSLRFTYLGYNVTGFRHAQSCDNIYKILGPLKFGLYNREKYGNYTNISLWGIFSTLIFINANKDKISNFNDASILKSGLLVLNGMGQQTKDNIQQFGLDNELTCGDISKRFSISSKAAGEQSLVNFTFNPIEQDKFVDIIPYSMSLRNMSTAARQYMSQNLYSLDSIFDISFKGCDSDGCKLSVRYIGNYNFGGIILHDTSALKERSVKIVIKVLDESNGEYQLTLRNVNPGGIVIDKTGNQKIKNKFQQFFKKDDIEKDIEFKNDDSLISITQEKTIELSDDFQKSVSFLLGFDIVKANTLTYDSLYNFLILNSNLLLRQLQTTYFILSVSNSKNPTMVRTNKFLSQNLNTENVYG